MTKRIARVGSVATAVALLILLWPGLQHCARVDACADASGVWDAETQRCLALWCTDEGGHWVEGPNYCIPRESCSAEWIGIV